ncbi:MAG: histidine kinase, partial [Micrococcales bacterium]|nr:histidine kinase [Micrococcales bacterium]
GIGPYALGSGWSAAWLLAPGVACLAVAIAALIAGGQALRRLAPRFLGPTDADRVFMALRREREAASANALARDLHDSIGHSLTAMTIQASAARVNLTRDPEPDAEAALRCIAAIENTGRAAVGELDTMLGVLRGHLAPAETNVNLSDHIETSRRVTGLDARVQVDLDGLPPAVRTELTRITQEALTNAAKHGAGPARLLLTRDPGELRLEVANPLRTQVEDLQSGGRGLLGVRERALLMGGSADAGPVDGQWRLIVRLPIDLGAKEPSRCRSPLLESP